MRKILTMIAAMFSTQIFAAPVLGYAIEDLEKNCEAIKRMAESAIDFRYSNSTQAEVLKATNEIFNKKEDGDYKRLFRPILQDAYKQQVYKEKINIKNEKKAFVDRYVKVCQASYKGF